MHDGRNNAVSQEEDSQSHRFDLASQSSCETTTGGVGLRARVVSWFLHRYPLINGCGTVANLPTVRSLMGRLPEFALAEVPGGLAALVPTDDYVGRAMFAIGDLDRKVSRTIRQFVGKGERVADIGANLGLCTLQLAALVGPTGEVVAFEPNPAMLSLLARSIELNRLVNVKVHACALGPSDGVANLGVPSTHAGKASLVVADGVDVRSVSVPVRSIDSIVGSQDRRLGFVKMDVEGFEEQVLRGAEGLLKRCPPEAWIFEMHEMPAMPQQSSLIATFSAAGYELFSITAGALRIRYVRIPEHGLFKRPPGHDVLAVHRNSAKLRHPALQGGR